MLRHTTLTELYDRTGDLRMVQDVADHTTGLMTERYAHVHPIAVARAMGAIEEGDGGGGAREESVARGRYCRR